MMGFFFGGDMNSANNLRGAYLAEPVSYVRLLEFRCRL